MDFDVIIVGAGAAGLAAGIFAGQGLPRGRVAVLDGAKKPGDNLVAGGGRCNVTNRRVTPVDFNGGSRHSIRNVLAAFGVEPTVAWFADMGVSLHEEEHGKLFPDSNQARTVLDALLRRLEQSGAVLLADHRVAQVEAAPDGFHVTTNHGTLRAGHVVLATGGMSLPKTGSDGGGYELARHLGHSIVPTTPGLVPLILDGTFHTDLSGISQDVELTIRADPAKPVRITGALLWTHFGISGPAVLDASRHWLRARLEGRTPAIEANLLRSDLQSAEARWLELTCAQPRTILRNALAGLAPRAACPPAADTGRQAASGTSGLPARVSDAISSALNIDGRVPLAHLAKDVRRRLLSSLVAWPLPVRDSRGYNHAEVTAGGVPLDEIDPATLQSRRCPGLYLVGEILDVDGRIGGFNFQWAWASGHIAGRACVTV